VHGDVCLTCHPAPADSLAGIWNGTCEQAGCHAAPLHPGVDLHGEDHGEGTDCWSCHEFGWDCTDCHGHIYDREPPTTTSNAAASYVGDATITLFPYDPPTADNVPPGGWGVKATYYRVDGGPVQMGTSILVPAPVLGTATHTIEFWSLDNRLNTEAPHKFATFTVSPGAPPPPMGVLTATPSGGSFSLTWSGGTGPYTVVVDGSDHATTGSVSYLYSPTVAGIYLLLVRDSLGFESNNVSVDYAPSAPVQVDYTYTGAPQTFTVPAGVTSVHVVIRGAGGGAGGPSLDEEDFGSDGDPGGLSSVTRLATVHRADGGSGGIGASGLSDGAAGGNGGTSIHAGFASTVGGGAAGDLGTNADLTGDVWAAHGGNGGSGGRLEGDITVAPGDVLTIVVGGGGRSAWGPTNSFGLNGSVSVSYIP
jgi:hypothetical protein